LILASNALLLAMAALVRVFRFFPPRLLLKGKNSSVLDQSASESFAAASLRDFTKALATEGSARRDLCRLKWHAKRSVTHMLPLLRFGGVFS